MADVTQVLSAIAADDQVAAAELLPLVYLDQNSIPEDKREFDVRSPNAALSDLERHHPRSVRWSNCDLSAG